MSLILDKLKESEDVTVVYNTCNAQIISFYDWNTLLEALQKMGKTENILNYFSYEEIEIFFEGNDIEMPDDINEPHHKKM